MRRALSAPALLPLSLHQEPGTSRKQARCIRNPHSASFPASSPPAAWHSGSSTPRTLRSCAGRYGHGRSRAHKTTERRPSPLHTVLHIAGSLHGTHAQMRQWPPAAPLTHRERPSHAPQRRILPPGCLRPVLNDCFPPTRSASHCSPPGASSRSERWRCSSGSTCTCAPPSWAGAPRGVKPRRCWLACPLSIPL